MIVKKKNPLLSSQSFNEDSTISYLFTSLDSGNYNFDIAEGCSVELTIIDLSLKAFNLALSFNVGKGAELKVNIASFLYGEDDKKFDVYVEHTGEKSSSLVKFAGVNSSKGKLTFIGTSKIPNGIRKVETRQEGRINNLVEGAKSEVSPVLLIKENDVKASHGAALGAYNPDVIFYLQSRGLTLEESKKLIIMGTLLPLINRLQDEKLIDEVNTFFKEKEI